MQFDTILTNAQVRLADQEPADVGITGGRVAAIAPGLSGQASGQLIDCGGRLLLPGFIDAHNHPYYEEDIQQFSASAAAGGITTLLSFAGMSGRTVNPAATAAAAATAQRGPGTVDTARDFIDYARDTSCLDVGVHAILTAADVDGMRTIPALRELGVRSFKLFMAFPGTRMVDDGRLLHAMQQIAALDGLCMVHCENGSAIARLESALQADGRRGMQDYIDSRPPELEAEAINRAITLAGIARCPLYVVHVSTARGLDFIRQARDSGGPPVYAETSPHFLLLTAADQLALGSRAKISPPMRSGEDVGALWAGIRDGVIDVIASDASGQCLPAKQAAGPDAFAAPFGLPGVTEMAPLVLDEASRRGVPVQRVLDCLTAGPAQIFGIGDRKGSLQVGGDADLVLYDQQERWEVPEIPRPGGVTDYSLYAGRAVTGRPVMSFSRGDTLLAAPGAPVRVAPHRYLRRT